MAYTKRSGVKSYKSKKGKYYSSTSSAAQTKWRKSKNPISQQAMRTGGWADPSLGTEVKFIDVNGTTQTAPSASSSWSAGMLLNGCVPGSGATDRVGRKIIIKSLLFRYSIQVAAQTGGGGRFRILVVYDKQTNATAPAITDILLADDWLSPNNLSNRDRFVTLCDEYTDPSTGTATTVGDFNDPCGMLKFKRLNLETMFNSGNAGTVADITTGSIYVFFSQPGTMTYTSATLNFRSRVRFLDP